MTEQPVGFQNASIEYDDLDRLNGVVYGVAKEFCTFDEATIYLIEQGESIYELTIESKDPYNCVSAFNRVIKGLYGDNESSKELFIGTKKLEGNTNQWSYTRQFRII